MNILNSGRFSMGSAGAGMIKKLIGESKLLHRERVLEYLSVFLKEVLYNLGVMQCIIHPQNKHSKLCKVVFRFQWACPIIFV